MKDIQVTREWFGKWFNSPYYHILYKHRDFEEARTFIHNLNDQLHFEPHQKALDLACGKGRHAIYMNSLGLDVTGVDLSPENIKEASRFANKNLHFYVHDMRKVFKKEEFHYVFNLFTSFGYFETVQENETAICATTVAIKPGGYFIIDFLNPGLVIDKMVPCEEKVIENINFEISRRFSEGYILKDIKFTADGKDFFFQEKVMAISKEEFLTYFEKAGLEIRHLYGDYDLNPFNKEVSQRMIFVLQKPLS